MSAVDDVRVSARRRVARDGVPPVPRTPARVCIQSRECSPALLGRLSGSTLFPERPFGAAIVATVCRGQGSVLYVTAPEMVDADEQVEYYVNLLPAGRAQCPPSRRDRVQVVSLTDGSPRWLSDKVLDRDSPDGATARKHIRDYVDRARQAGADVRLSYFEPSANLERLAADLGVPGDQADSRYIPLGTKVAGRRLFDSLRIAVPAGGAECRTVGRLAASVAGLWRDGHRNIVLKLSSTEYAAGMGNALLNLGEPRHTEADGMVEAVLGRLPTATLVDDKITWTDFAAAVGQSGAVAEELVGGEEVRSPSFQGRIGENGQVSVVSTHEQVLVGGGQTYVGSVFPAADDYRATVIEHGARVGQKLSELGVRRGDYGVDFLAARRGGTWSVLGCELNLRATGTKHGFTMATNLLATMPDENGRLFVDGAERVYQASDGIADARYVGLRPRQLIESLQDSDLRYDHARKTGVVLHMMSAVLSYGKFGAVCIGRSHAQAADLMSAVRELADGLV